MKKLISFALVAVTVVILAACIPAMAAEAAAPAAAPFAVLWQQTIEPLILSLLGTIVTAAVGYVVNLIRKKWGLEISATTQQRIQAVAMQSVLAVEEMAARHLKTRGEKWVGEMKHKEAVNIILARVPSLTREQADHLVHTALAMIPGLGASGALGVMPAPAAIPVEPIVPVAG